MANFADDVRSVVRGIPKGQTLSYGEVATAAGYPGAARAVGTVMANNFDKTVPCHRVIKADGTPDRYNRSGGEEAKRKKLRAEGAKI